MSVTDANRIVVKVGTSTLTHENGKLNIRRIAKLTSVLADLKNDNKEIVLVTSGAIGVGLGKLGIKERPREADGRQAAATIGQCELMFMYDKFFSEYGYLTGQLLVTKGDIEDKTRRKNLLATFEKLFEFGAVPIVNENDSVAIDEIVFGDNDTLSAVVAKLISADLLIILTDADGLYDKDPSKESDAKLIPVVEKITDEIEKSAGGAGSILGTGGMITKIQAAKIASKAGIDTVVMNGEYPQKIYKVLDGKPIGTLFKSESGE